MLYELYWIWKVESKMYEKPFHRMMIMLSFYLSKIISLSICQILNIYLHIFFINSFILYAQYIQALFLLRLCYTNVRNCLFAIFIQKMLLSSFQLHSISCKKHFTYLMKYVHILHFKWKVFYTLISLYFVYECKYIFMHFF